MDLPNDEAGNAAIGSLWARSRIADLERSMRHGENPTTVAAITDLGLAHSLVTQWTSFVAVEEKLVVSDGQPRQVRVPVDMPQGVSWQGVFGGAGSAGESMHRLRSAGVQMHHDAVAKSLAVPEQANQPAPGIPSQIPSRGCEEKDEIRSAESCGLAIQMTVLSQDVASSGSIRLRIVYTNRGSVAVQVPANTHRGFAGLGLRWVDVAWQEHPIGAAQPGSAVPTASLAPGDALIREVDIPVSSLGSITNGTMVHIILDGTLWGSTDVPRVSIRIGAV
jgi:hypothetical protein